MAGGEGQFLTLPARTSHADNTDTAGPADDGGDERGDLVRGVWPDVVVGVAEDG